MTPTGPGLLAALPPLLPLALAGLALLLYLAYLVARTVRSREPAPPERGPELPGPAAASLRAALDWLAEAPDGRRVEIESPYGGRQAELRGRGGRASLTMSLAGRIGERVEVGRDLADPVRRAALVRRLERVFPPTSSQVVILTFEIARPEASPTPSDVSGDSRSTQRRRPGGA
ncbi:MAG TPA: hypothetical protein VF763_14310 [Candidatus Limnocylindrales bacterium]